MLTRHSRRMLGATVLALCVTAGAASHAQSNTDRDGISRTSLDYIEGFYTGDPVRMERALHPDLAKRIMRVDAAGKARLEHMDATRLIGAARRRQGLAPPAQQQKDLTILDVFGNTASVKIIANEWVDYLHLVKWEGRWVIVNVLWEMKPRAR